MCYVLIVWCGALAVNMNFIIIIIVVVIIFVVDGGGGAIVKNRFRAVLV